jgi:hypothetical protein
MYKQLYHLVYRLIAFPSEAWKSLSEMQDEKNEEFFKGYFYPILGIIALCAFVGEAWINVDKFALQSTLKVVIRDTIAYFGGLFLSAYIIRTVALRYFRFDADFNLCVRFSGYSSAVIYSVAALNCLSDSLIFIQIFIIYTFYIVWCGIDLYIPVKEDDRVKFTIFSGIVVIISPFFIKGIMIIMMPNL